MKILSAKFIKGAVSARQYPPESLPEFAFAGRSNVGKSSLIRTLLNRKKLVRTSATPGKTQEINFFSINERLIFTDLPGYGYAKVPPPVQRRWKKMIEQYLTERQSLRALVFLVDLRRSPTQLDLDLKHWLDALGIRYILVATKTDKVRPSERKKQKEQIREAFFGEKEGGPILFSSQSKTGRKELWNAILKLADADDDES